MSKKPMSNREGLCISVYNPHNSIRKNLNNILVLFFYYVQVFFIVACLCVLVLHSQCQPYISKWANLGETFLLFGLTNLATLQLVDEDDCRDKISASILVVTNFYVLVIALYLTVNFIRFKCRRKGYTRVTQVPVDNVPPVRPLTPGKRYSTPTRVLGYPIDNN